MIEKEVAKHKLSMRLEMEACMEQLRSSMHRDYQRRVDAAVKEAVDSKAAGAFSSAQQPDLA